MIGLCLLLLCLTVACYHASLKPLPQGLSFTGPARSLPERDVAFLCDVTATRDGGRVYEQAIFDAALTLIRNAETFVLADFFLFNDYQGRAANAAHRDLCREFTDTLLAKKKERPGIRMVVVTDPVNQAYGSVAPHHLAELRAAGIDVVVTDLRRLRDSNPAYSGFWRVLAAPFGPSAHGIFPHPFDPKAPGVGLRAWLSLLNFKANHRKILVTDAPCDTGGRQLASLVASANPHNGSSAHSNVALLLRGDDIARDWVRCEQAVLDFSGGPKDLAADLPPPATPHSATGPSGATGAVLQATALTEGAIRATLLQTLARTGPGDMVDVAMFYLSERQTIDALASAARRGAEIRLLLDPNRDAFGYRKNGIPNRSVATELFRRGQGRIAVRWYDTHGEQFHDKMVLIRQRGQTTLLLGSANLTRRNLADLNLESDIMVRGDPTARPLRDAEHTFQRFWTNADASCSLPYASLAPPSRWQALRSRFQEWSGLSTF